MNFFHGWCLWNRLVNQGIKSEYKGNQIHDHVNIHDQGVNQLTFINLDYVNKSTMKTSKYARFNIF